MLSQVKRFLASPVFPDDAHKTAVAKILNNISLFFLAIVICLVPLIIVTAGDLKRTLSWAVPAIVILFGIKVIIAKGFVHQASLLLISMLWFLGLVSTGTAGGVQAPGYSSFAILVLLAGILLGWRFALGMAVINSSLGILFMWLASQGRLPDSALPDNDFRVWLFHAVTVLVIALLLRTGLGSIREALAQAQNELHQRQLSEEKFIKVFMLSPNALHISELESGNFLNVNESFERLSGYTKDEVIGRNATELGIYAENEGRETWLSLLKTWGFVRDVEMSLRHASGSFRSCLLSIEQITLDDVPCVITQVQDITERKRAEAETVQARDDLRVRETQLRTILNNLPFWVWLKDVNGRFLMVNDLIVRDSPIFSTENQFIGKTDADISPPEFSQKYMADDLNVMETRKPLSLEEPVLIDGQTRLYETYKAPYLDDNNQVLGTFGFSRDITERKRAEAAVLQARDDLRVREAQLRTILNNLPFWVWLKDVNGRFLAVNDSFVRERANVATLEDVLGKTDADFESSALGAPEFLQEELEVMANGEPLNREMTIEFDGEEKFFQVYKAPFVDHTNQIIGTFGYSQDITKHKRAEQILMESVSRFRSIFEDAGIGMVLVSLDHAIVQVNRAFANMLGYTTDELVGIHFKDITYPNDVKISIDHHQRLIAGELKGYQFEKRYLHKDGRIVWAMLNVSLVDSVDGEPNQAIAQVQNINDRKQAEADRELLIQELEKRNAELERFAYTVSHDLKSPLVTIGGFLGFLERDVERSDWPQLRADISSIRSAANKMRLLLDELLELSRIGRLMNPPEEIPFAEIVEEALAVTQGQLINHSVEILGIDTLPTIIGDRIRLVEVVQNLVDNAAKFSNDQPLPIIKIGMRQDETLPVFFVQDNGIGILPQYHEKIFEIFNKLNPDVEGTGIGLALAKRIIEVHNGRLWVESDGLGHGSTFCFTLNDPGLSDA